jgi:glycosyltransferase involved in cell wall biosynthesis
MTKLQVIYFAPGDIQVARVDRQCIVYFCEALHRLDTDVKLVSMGIRLMKDELQKSDPLDLYRIEQKFPSKIIPTLVHQESNSHWIILNRLFVHLTQAVRFIRAFKHNGSNNGLFFYIKNYSSALVFLFLRIWSRCKPFVVFEAHCLPKNSFQRFVLKKVDAVVANSYALAKELVISNFVSSRKVMGSHQGVNLKLIEAQRISKNQAKEKLGLPVQSKIAVYTGKVVFGYREIDYLLETAKLLPSDIELLIVGGRADHVHLLREHAADNEISNVRFAGFVPPNVVQFYQFAADVLLLYYPSGMELNKYRSPGKLFEYMAAGRPIIAVDLPVLREVLGQDPSAIMVPPDSPADLSKAILDLYKRSDRGKDIASRSLKRVAEFTWEKRARKIMNFLLQTMQTAD